MSNPQTFDLGELDIPASILAQLELSAMDTAAMLLQAVGIQVVSYLRSLTSEMRPPVGAEQTVSFTTKEGEEVSFVAFRGSDETERPAHPGHWADVSGDLARAYAWDVKREKDVVTLVLSNNMEYAAALEARDGFFVLKGIMDPGGPVELALVEVIRQVAPDWELKR